MDGSVMYKEPDALTDESPLLGINNGGFEEFLQDDGHPPGQEHESRSWRGIRAQNEAGIMRSQRSSEHTRTPRPPGIHHLVWNAQLEDTTWVTVLLIVERLHIYSGMVSLFFTWVRDLWDRWDTLATWSPIGWSTNTTKVAITYSENLTSSPWLVVLGATWSFLLIKIQPPPPGPLSERVSRGMK